MRLKNATVSGEAVSNRAREVLWIRFFLLVLLASLAACRTGPILQSPNIDAKSWTIRRGQAVWQRDRKAPPIAGELLVATNPDGQFLVQFTKTPFPTVIAQAAPTQWQVQFFPQGWTFSGRGEPPGKWVWFQLPRALAGAKRTLDWSFHAQAKDAWRLENLRTGESLEGYLAP